MEIWALVEPRKPLRAMEVEDPAPRGTEIVVAVSHCGLCHSDLHFWEGEYNLGGGRKMNILERGVTLPRAPGHEMVGTVVALGPEATGVAIEHMRVDQANEAIERLNGGKVTGRIVLERAPG